MNLSMDSLRRVERFVDAKSHLQGLLSADDAASSSTCHYLIFNQREAACEKETQPRNRQQINVDAEHLCHALIRFFHFANTEELKARI
jgi:hypothetical protein